MLFALIVKPRGGLWMATAYYTNKRGQTEVSSSWHVTRADAVCTLSYHF